jgi:putative tryptophan/tyrosine transport system substrate-binding protein
MPRPLRAESRRPAVTPLMDRRAFLGALGLLAAPLAVEGQRADKVWRVAWLAEERDPGRGHPAPGGGLWFFEALRELGYVEGQNLAIEYRFAADRAERLPQLAAELATLKVDLIAVPGTREALAAKAETSTIPIVTLFVGDPVGTGLVSSLRAPGGNVTGTSLMGPDLAGKRLELLREIIPKLRRICALWNPQNASTTINLRGAMTVAKSLGIEMKAVGIPTRDRLDEALREVARDRPDGLFLFQDAVIVSLRVQIADFALRNRLPTTTQGRMYVESGCLLGYGPDMRALARRAATYADRIFRDAKPSDLPVEQPTKFELVINLKTAKALGLTIPPSLLQRADQVIE